MLVEDLGSLNGTFVDGRRLEQPTVVLLHSEIRMGASEFQVEVSIPQATQVSAPVARPAFAPTMVGAAAPAGLVARAPAPGPAPGEESVVESPNLPIPASIAIFAATVIAMVLILVFTW